MGDMTLAWMDAANCATTDPDLFYPDRWELGLAAKKVCAACEVRPECLAFALDTDEQEGVWGGKTARQRRAMKRGAA